MRRLNMLRPRGPAQRTHHPALHKETFASPGAAHGFACSQVPPLGQSGNAWVRPVALRHLGQGSGLVLFEVPNAGSATKLEKKTKHFSPVHALLSDAKSLAAPMD